MRADTDKESKRVSRLSPWVGANNLTKVYSFWDIKIFNCKILEIGTIKTNIANTYDTHHPAHQILTFRYLSELSENTNIVSPSPSPFPSLPLQREPLSKICHSPCTCLIPWINMYVSIIFHTFYIQFILEISNEHPPCTRHSSRC